jgi:predicted CXXCH cytochrome family protein
MKPLRLAWIPVALALVCVVVAGRAQARQEATEAPASPAPPGAWSVEDCQACHEKAVGPAFARTTHARADQSCASCHQNVGAREGPERALLQIAAGAAPDHDQLRHLLRVPQIRAGEVSADVAPPRARRARLEPRAPARGQAALSSDYSDTELTALSLQLDYVVGEHLSLGGGYAYEKYVFVDAFSGGTEVYPLAGAFYLKANDGPYEVNVVYAKLSCRF